MSPTPSVSVVLPVRNAEATIEAAVQSVLRQSFRDFELLVIDDGSSDGTRDRLTRAAARDARMRVVTATGSGVTAALNQGIRSAVGQYVARQDGDDLSLPERFARQVQFLDAHTGVCAVGCAAVTIDDQGRDVGRFTTRHGVAAVRDGVISVRATPVHGSMMMRRDCLTAVGGYREAFRSCQDYDLWLRLLERWDIDNVEDVLYQWRLSRSSAYGARRTTQLMYGGIAQAFAVERSRFPADSYAQFEAAGDALEAFADHYRLGGLLRGFWGNLLLRGVGDARLAHHHFSLAVRHGQRDPRTVVLWAWTSLGLPWIGGRPLRPNSRDYTSGSGR